MAVMQLVGAQARLAASRPYCTELLMRIMRSLLASSSAGESILFTIRVWELNPSHGYTYFFLNCRPFANSLRKTTHMSTSDFKKKFKKQLLNKCSYVYFTF